MSLLQDHISRALIRVPEDYPAMGEVFADETTLLIVRHPIVRTRIDQVALAKLLSQALDPARAGSTNSQSCTDWSWCGPDAFEQQRRARRWLSSWGYKFRSPGKCLEITPSTDPTLARILPPITVWFVEDPDQIPITHLSGAVLSDVVSYNEAQYVSYRASVCAGGQFIVLGPQPPRTHFAYALTLEDEPERSEHVIKLADVISAYPDVAVEADSWKTKLAADVYRRLLLCEDVETTATLRESMRRFAERRLTIRTRQSELVPFRLNSSQRRYLARRRLDTAKGAKARFLVLKSRRRGLTTLEQALQYQLCSSLPHQQCATLAHTDAATRRIFKISKLFHERDPQAEPIKGPGNSTKLEFKSNGSEFFIGTAGGRAFGRGDTLNYVHGSEVAFWCEGPNQYENVSTLVAGLTEAASHGTVVLETTPNGVEWFCETYKAAKAGTNDWVPVFLPWFTDPENVVDVPEDESTFVASYSEAESRLVEKHNLSPQQIAWRRSKKKELGYLFDQEYPEDDVSCFLTTGIHYFDKELIMEWVGQCSDPPLLRQVPGGIYFEYEAPQEGVDYRAGSDTSEGLATSDNNGTIVIRHDTGKIVAGYYGLFTPVEQARLGAKLTRSYNKALWGIERENHGHAVIGHAIELFKCKPVSEGGTLFESNGRPGWTTNSQTRPVLLDTGRTFMDDAPEECLDERLLGEALTFKKQKNGKFEHDSGAHDDFLFMWMIAHQMRSYRKKRMRLTTSRSVREAREKRKREQDQIKERARQLTNGSDTDTGTSNGKGNNGLTVRRT